MPLSYAIIRIRKGFDISFTSKRGNMETDSLINCITELSTKADSLQAIITQFEAAFDKVDSLALVAERVDIAVSSANSMIDISNNYLVYGSILIGLLTVAVTIIFFILQSRQNKETRTVIKETANTIATDKDLRTQLISGINKKIMDTNEENNLYSFLEKMVKERVKNTLDQHEYEKAEELINKTKDKQK